LGLQQDSPYGDGLQQSIERKKAEATTARNGTKVDLDE
tara:strand:- start:9751 stop:9864 length:114 start_codon:yes stop_codon:yes gene_type:complete